MVRGRLGGEEGGESRKVMNGNFGMIFLEVSVLEGLGLLEGSPACLDSLCFAGPPQLVEVWF